MYITIKWNSIQQVLMEKKRSRIYYSPEHLNGLPVFIQLANKAGAYDNIAKLWLMKKAILQI